MPDPREYIGPNTFLKYHAIYRLWPHLTMVNNHFKKFKFSYPDLNLDLHQNRMNSSRSHTQPVHRRPTTAQPPRQTSHHLRLPPSQPTTTPPVNTERRAAQGPFGDWCRMRRAASVNGGLSEGGNGSRELHAPFFSVQWASVGQLCPTSKRVYVNSIWAEIRIKRGSRPLFARPMADRGGGVAPPPMAF